MSSIFRESATPTPREQELIMLIRRGLQNKVIAYELSISENTVRAHISNIMRKYNLHNRTQIAVMFTTH
jgi:DNA-binding NarL/FixJ family response regulator